MAYRAWDFWVRRSWMLWVLAVLVLLLDQSTKSLIVAWLDWGQSWPEEGFLRITHARNTGTAFSLFQGHSNILSFVAYHRGGGAVVGVRDYGCEVVHIAGGSRAAAWRCAGQFVGPAATGVCDRLPRRRSVADI